LLLVLLLSARGVVGGEASGVVGGEGLIV